MGVWSLSDEKCRLGDEMVGLVDGKEVAYDLIGKDKDQILVFPAGPTSPGRPSPPA